MRSTDKIPLVALALVTAFATLAVVPGMPPRIPLVLAALSSWSALLAYLYLRRRNDAGETPDTASGGPGTPEDDPFSAPDPGASEAALPLRRALRDGDHCAFALYSPEELRPLERTYEGVNAPAEANAVRTGAWDVPAPDAAPQPVRGLLEAREGPVDPARWASIVEDRHPWARVQPMSPTGPTPRSGPPPPPPDPVDVVAPDLHPPVVETPGLDAVEPHPDPPPDQRCDLPVSTHVDRLPVLAPVCRIHLGELRMADDSLLDLFTEVPSDYAPTRSREEMLAACAPSVASAMNAPALQGFTALNAHQMIFYPTMMGGAYATLSPPGLFWPEGYFHNAFVMALVLLHRYARLADPPAPFAAACDFASTRLRDDMESRRFNVFMFSAPVCGWRNITEEGFFQGPVFDIAVDSWGKVRPTRFYHGASGWAFLQNVHVCSAMRMEAALADYYLWWAQRLYSYVLDGESPRPLWDLYMALACARCGLAELFEIGALIVHEYAHLFGGSLWHCSNNRGSYACCQYAIEGVYRNRTAAALGLPRPHFAVGGQNDIDLTLPGQIGRRLSERPWTEFLSPGDCPRGPEVTMALTPVPTLRFEHAGLLEPHELTFRWNLHDDCIDAGQNPNSSQTYPA